MTIARLGPNGPPITLPSSPKTTYYAGGAAVTIDWRKGPSQKVTLDAASTPCVITSVGLPAYENAQLTLEVVQGPAGNGTIAFVSGQKASPFVLSTTGNAKDLVDLQWNGNEGLLLASIRGKAFA